ncbi:MAG: SdrD B-like domain-containing protein [Cyanobacteria bacterium J06598_3]
MSKRHPPAQPSHTANINQPRPPMWRTLMVALLISGGLLTPKAIAQVTSAPPGTISNQASGSFVDPADSSTTTVESNIVTVTVSEVAGITVVSNGYTEPSDGMVNTGDTVFFDFVVQNVGNDPTQFFIPGAPSAISGGIAGPIEIIAYDPDGSGPGGEENLSGNNITVPAGGDNTGNLLAPVAASTNNGSVPAGGTLTVRVPVTITGATGTDVSVTLGNTTPPPDNQNQPYTTPVTDTENLYTVDNTNADNGDTNGASASGEREASDSVIVAIAAILPTDFGDAPDTYGTDATPGNSGSDPAGARHFLVSDLYLGTTAPNAETDANSPLDGTGDGPEEDGAATLPDVFTDNVVYVIGGEAITITNNTPTAATLHGWIDFNRDGTFEASEHTSVPVPANVIGNTNDLVWSGMSGMTAGDTFARFRLTSDTNITPSTPGGVASDGEVEDYQITITEPPYGGSGVCNAAYSLVYSGQGGSIVAVHVESGTSVPLTTSALNTANGLSTDFSTRQVYYGAGNSLYAWSPLTDTHVVVDNNISSYISRPLPANFSLSSGGAAFFDGSAYQGSDIASGGIFEIFKIDFVPGSGGLTIDSVTPVGIDDLVQNGTLTNSPNWGDFIIDDFGVITANGNGGQGYWGYDLNTDVFTDLVESFGANSQLAKDGQGRLWALGAGVVFQVEASGNSLIEIPGTRNSTPGHTSFDGAECVVGDSTIGDRVWEDTNGDGVQDPGENGISNVTVDLFWDLNGNGVIDGNDPLLDTRTTNIFGNYDFDELIFGNYIVQVSDNNNVLTDRALTSSTDTIAVTLPAGAIDFNDADFGYEGPASDPDFLLVKRITAINRGLDDEQLFDNDYINVGAADDNDNAENWPGPPTAATFGGGTVESYIAGVTGVDDVTAVANTKVGPGDVIEYTIPFLSAGDAPAQDVLICDRIPANTTFVPDAFNALTPTFTGGGSRGILLSFNNETLALTNANDGDESIGTGPDDGFGGYYFPPGEDPSSTFPGLDCASPNNTGAVVVDLSDVPNSTGDGTPDNAYGFVRFRVVVD